MTNDRLKFRTPVYKDKKVWKFFYWDAGKKVVPVLTKRLSFKEDEQCTGFEDKNGKLAYKGDIISIPRLEVNYEKGESDNFFGVIKLDDESGNFFVEPLEGGFENLEVIKESQIIGNIHENPELLKGE